MKEHPILFSSPMVRAILAGTKTQTRRIVKPQPSLMSEHDAAWRDAKCDLWRNAKQFARDCCPYGKPGDLLWLRETFADPHYISTDPDSETPVYRADNDYRVGPSVKWRPSIFMPRWASRITLEITGVRVERLQDITEADAQAEGIESYVADSENGAFSAGPCWYRMNFRYLWDKINGKRAPWDDNPWVWVLEFKRAKP